MSGDPDLVKPKIETLVNQAQGDVQAARGLTDAGGVRRVIQVGSTDKLWSLKQLEVDVGADRTVSEYTLLHYLLYKDLVGKQALYSRSKNIFLCH